MSHTQATSCKLPLLDGEVTAKARLIVTDLQLGNIERIQHFGKGDITSFSELLCTAWGLLLRCYTGQDDISFHFHQSINEKLVSNSTVPPINQSTFRMVFDEHETLSTCFAKAKDGYAGNERGGPSLVSTALESRSLSAASYQNTHVWIQDSTRKDTQDVAVEKVP